MKAMILAAGLGTRLRPFTERRPKALFTVNNIPVLALAIDQVRRAGFDTVLINTHHGHGQIEDFLAGADPGVRIEICHEPEILGTGGALVNVAGRWATEPLLVVNADIVSDIDLRQVCEYHGNHHWPVTMVMHDHADFNNVAVDADGFVTRFRYRAEDQGPEKAMAFAGIHVVDPRVRDFLPATGPSHIISAYENLLAAGEKIKAYLPPPFSWHDIGTPERYRQAVLDRMVPVAFGKAFGAAGAREPGIQPLHGDGSDRRWFRLRHGDESLILADHGICCGEGRQEVDAYVAIGGHLRRRRVPVPHIYLHDRCSGLVFLEDLGDTLLQDGLGKMSSDEVLHWYRRVIDGWITMAMDGGRGFDPDWTYQTPRYDRRVIIDNECRYFMEAFVRGHLGWDMDDAPLMDEFEWIARQIESHAVTGFLHRDLQSRNIMLRKEEIYFVDFQGGRLGPLQYDLAALLIDPYASLPVALQRQLYDHALRQLQERHGIDAEKFRRGYPFCALARNLQMLGAFGFLTDTKGKSWFARYIPRAVSSLHRRLAAGPAERLPRLKALAEKLQVRAAEKT